MRVPGTSHVDRTGGNIPERLQRLRRHRMRPGRVFTAPHAGSLDPFLPDANIRHLVNFAVVARDIRIVPEISSLRWSQIRAYPHLGNPSLPRQGLIRKQLRRSGPALPLLSFVEAAFHHACSSSSLIHPHRGSSDRLDPGNPIPP